MAFRTEPLELDPTAADNGAWRRLMGEKLRSAVRFEIHCWNEETEELALALKFGSRKPSDWDYGQVVEGPVTEGFRHWLLTLPKPTDTELCNKMTPFFSVFLDNGFCSEHYGTELYQIPRKD